MVACPQRIMFDHDSFKGAGSQTYKVYKLVISIIYVVAHTWPFYSAQIFMDRVYQQ